MSIWTDLATRELALLAILLALGSGPASLLPSRFDAVARIALAPLLGFCLGTSIATTLLQFFPAGDTYLVIPAVAVLSAGVAARRALRSRGWRTIGPRDLAQLAVVCAVVAVPLNVTLHERHTVGPVSYYFTDVDNYVAVQQTAETTSLGDARAEWLDKSRTGTSYPDLTEGVYGFFSDFGSNLDAGPLHANVNALIGVAAVDTFGPFLIVLLLMGGLAMYGAVRTVAGKPTWMAALAGALFGGPFFLELWFDTYQAAIIALGLLIPTVVLGAQALREPRRATLALLALLLATYVTVYPLFIPPLLAIAAAAIAWRAVVLRRGGERLGGLVQKLVAPALGVGLMAVMFNLVAVVRTVGYYARVLRDDFPFPRVGFTLPPDVLPGWLLQTREFWFLLPWQGGFSELVYAALIPAMCFAFVAVAVRRHLVGLALAGLGAVFGLLAYYAYASEDACTYCAQRYLLALAPILAALLALGLWHALKAPSRVWKVVGVCAALVVVASVGQRARVELDRFSDASFFFDTSNRAALQALPADGRPLHVEGYWASVSAQAEQALTYHMATERARGPVSISLEDPTAGAPSYLSVGSARLGREFRPDYRYVLTRFSGVAGDRRLIVRRGAISLMERTRPLDVTPYFGLTLEMARRDGSGVPWIRQGSPLRLRVVGPGSAPAWARLELKTAVAVEVPRQAGVRARARGDVLTVCIRATGRAPIRDAALDLPVPGPRAVFLTAMRAVTGRCSVK